MRTVGIVLLTTLMIFASCGRSENKSLSVRVPVDSVGFAVTAKQMDSVMARLERVPLQTDYTEPWIGCISPHDDYQYVNNIYPAILGNIKSGTVILFGVAHKAATLGLSDSLVFDSHESWSGPYGNVKISPLREEIMRLLNKGYYTVSDPMHNIEHSLESMVPFLQYYNRDVEIVPILVPYMSPQRMRETGIELAGVISEIIAEKSLVPGKDISIVITSDAVHYGTEDWGSNDYAWFGCDQAGNEMALARENEIIDNCLVGEITDEKIALFSNYTLSEDDFRVYNWSWCGRYSIPVGLYTLSHLKGITLPPGKLVAYSTSIINQHIDFTDIGMGVTAIATDCHWVGYPAIGF